MQDPKQLALRALTGAFIDRDPGVVERYFAPDYIQHNPAIPNGPRAESTDETAPLAPWSGFSMN